MYFPILHCEQNVRTRHFVIHMHHNVPPALVKSTNFCKQTFVNGKVANPKSVAGDITASNNCCRKTKSMCLFKHMSLLLLKFVPSNLQTMGKYGTPANPRNAHTQNFSVPDGADSWSSVSKQGGRSHYLPHPSIGQLLSQAPSQSPPISRLPARL